MDEKKLKWCCNQKKGIELIEEKEHLAEEYEKEAEESLNVCLQLKGTWKIISGYYACYDAFYSILMKCGIKSEIHDCTLELLELFDFSDDEKEFIRELKKKRINSQYYLKKEELESDKKIKEFVFRCKEIANSLNSENIEEIRNKIRGIQK